MDTDQNTNQNMENIAPRSEDEVTEIIRRLGNRRQYEQKRWHGRKPKPVKQIMADLMIRRGLGRVLATEQLSNTWREIVGDHFASQSQPGKLRGGVLEIIVTHTIFKQEMQYTEKQVLTQLHQLAPDMKIRSLRYRVGQIHEPHHKNT